MKLILIRHGAAEVTDPKSGKSFQDALRPLSAEGVRQIEIMAKAMKLLCNSVDRVISSSLVRGRETADIIAKAFGTKTLAGFDVLWDGSPADLYAELTDYASETLVLVGHLPGVNEFFASMLYEQSSSCVGYANGCACQIDFSGKAQAGRGMLQWFLNPKQAEVLTGSG